MCLKVWVSQGIIRQGHLMCRRKDKIEQDRQCGIAWIRRSRVGRVWASQSSAGSKSNKWRGGGAPTPSSGGLVEHHPLITLVPRVKLSKSQWRSIDGSQLKFEPVQPSHPTVARLSSQLRAFAYKLAFPVAALEYSTSFEESCRRC